MRFVWSQSRFLSVSVYSWLRILVSPRNFTSAFCITYWLVMGIDELMPSTVGREKSVFNFCIICFSLSLSGWKFGQWIMMCSEVREMWHVRHWESIVSSILDMIGDNLLCLLRSIWSLRLIGVENIRCQVRGPISVRSITFILFEELCIEVRLVSVALLMFFLISCRISSTELLLFSFTREDVCPSLARESALSFPAIPTWLGIHSLIICFLELLISSCFCRILLIRTLLVDFEPVVNWRADRESHTSTLSCASYSLIISNVLSIAHSSVVVELRASVSFQDSAR